MACPGVVSGRSPPPGHLVTFPLLKGPGPELGSQGLCMSVSEPVSPCGCEGGRGGGGPHACWAGGAGGAGGLGKAAESPALPQMLPQMDLCPVGADGWVGHTQHRFARARQGVVWTAGCFVQHFLSKQGQGGSASAWPSLASSSEELGVFRGWTERWALILEEPAPLSAHHSPSSWQPAALLPWAVH